MKGEPKLRAKANKNGKYSLYIDIFDSGSRHKKYLNLIVSQDYTKVQSPVILKTDQFAWREAKKQFGALYHDIMNNNLTIKQIKSQETDYIKYFEGKLKQKNNDSYGGALKHLRIFSRGSTITFKTVTETWLNDFKNYLLEKVSVNTCRQYIERLNIIWNEARKEKLTNQNPFEFLSMPKGTDPEKNYLEVEELRRLFDTPVQSEFDIKEAFIFACYTGMRIGDLRLRVWSDIIDNEIHFRQQKSKRKFMQIPIHPVGLEMLARMPKEREFIFNLPKAKNYKLTKELIKWGESAGIAKRMHFHLSRHTFGTQFQHTTGNIYLTKDLMGHGDLKHTEGYATISKVQKWEGINRLPDISKKGKIHILET